MNRSDASAKILKLFDVHFHHSVKYSVFGAYQFKPKVDPRKIEMEYRVAISSKIEVRLEMDHDVLFVIIPRHMISSTQIGIRCHLEAEISKVINGP